METHPIIYSKGNGQAEKAVQSIEEMVRTLMIHFKQMRREKLSGRMTMYIFGPLLLITLLFSWNRSNDARYEWLNRDD